MRTDHTLRQWIDLGDVTGSTCFPTPDQCSQGLTLSFWYRMIECPGNGGFITAGTRDAADNEGNAPTVKCTTGGGFIG